jgi:hypothetical protein
MSEKLTAFSWGYCGWGSATRELVWAFGEVEKSRGYGEPLFVDVRVSRSVRAAGFLDLILEQQRLLRRIVFFCGCESPWRAHECHRGLVGATLLKAARARKVDLWLQEWPGGEVSDRDVPSAPVRSGTLKSLASNGKWATLLEPPDANLLGSPTGSLVSLEEGSSSRVVSVCPPRFVSGHWKLQLFVEAAPELSRSALLREVQRKRAELLLEARRT